MRKRYIYSFKTSFFVVSILLSSLSIAEDVYRTPSNENILIMSIETGDVIIELAPQFAPKHVANIKQLVAQNYFDGTVILRSQDNYVVQWGDPKAGSDEAKTFGQAKKRLNTEFFRDIESISFNQIVSRDSYADNVGFVDGFAVASDGDKAWMAHCYGAVGVSRGMSEDSGNGSGLYVVTGHSPRHLDLNVTLVGRVLKGMELLSSLPRGTGNLGFFETEEETIPVQKIVQGFQKDAQKISIMRTDSEAFKQHVKQRTYRTKEWFLEPSGKIELCNVGVPSR